MRQLTRDWTIIEWFCVTAMIGVLLAILCNEIVSQRHQDALQTACIGTGGRWAITHYEVYTETDGVVTEPVWGCQR